MYVPKYLQYSIRTSSVLLSFNKGVGGVMVSIAAFQAVDLGSIPGQCNFSISQNTYITRGNTLY